jgi:putative transposase
MQYRTIKTRLYLDKNDKVFLLNLMHSAKSLYNQALYNVRQHFIKNQSYLSYKDNYKLLKDTSEHYRILSTSQGQTIIKKVDEAMKAFFGSLKKNQHQKVRLPKYLDKQGYYSLVDRMVYKPNKKMYVMPRGNFIKKVSNDLLETSAKLDLKTQKDLQVSQGLSICIKTPKCIQNKIIKEITIKTKLDGKYIEVIYTYMIDEEIGLDKEKGFEAMGIDFGYNNLAYCALTNHQHLHIDGLKLKSMNQRYHKQMARLSSLRENQKGLTKRMASLIEKRNNQMSYGIYKAAKLIIDHAVKQDVGLIVIGYNKGFKDINLTHQFNQMSRSIPIARLRDRIIFLAKQYGIETKVIDEAYTSKASYLDQDRIPNIDDGAPSIFSGKRVKRGLYLSKDKIWINADLNAALNILKKGNPEAKWIGSKGVNTPKRTYLI